MNLGEFGDLLLEAASALQGENEAASRRLHEEILERNKLYFDARGEGDWPSTFIDTGRLERSLTRLGGENIFKIEAISDEEIKITVGSRVEYAEYLERRFNIKLMPEKDYPEVILKWVIAVLEGINE